MKRIILVIGLMCLFVSAYAWEILTNDAAWPRRDRFSMVDYDGRMWIISGALQDDTTKYPDAWYSYNGIDWEAATRNTAFTGRLGARTVVFKNEMYLVGGASFIDTPWVAQNDVWKSSDGIDWQAVTRNAEWTGRIDMGLLVFNNELWIIGGGTYGVQSTDEVWHSSDGITWTQGASLPNARQYMTAFVFDNKMWYLGGTDGTNYFFDLYNSSDGITWNLINSTFIVGGDTLISYIYNNEIYVYAQYSRQMWKSTNGVAWTDVTPGHNIYRSRDSSGVIFGNYFIMAYGYCYTGSGLTDLNSVWYQDLSISNTATITETHTITPTSTATPTLTSMETKTFSPTASPTFTNTPVNTETPSITETWTVSETITVSPTFTITVTPTPIETIMLWYASTDTDWHKTDIRLSWRQYPDTLFNKVIYTLYYIAINRATDYPHVIYVPNEDDISPSADIFTYDLQGVPFEDIISVTITAQGGDLGVSEFSNNIAISPKASPTP